MQPGQTPAPSASPSVTAAATAREHWTCGLATGENGEHLLTADGKPMPIGANVFGFATVKDGVPRYDAFDVTVEATGAEYPSQPPKSTTRSWTVTAW